MLGACLTYLITLAKGSRSRTGRTVFLPFVAGAMFCLSFESRFQMALMIFGVLSWVVTLKKAGWDQILSCGIGFLVIFAAGRGADACGYGDWGGACDVNTQSLF